MNKIGKLQSIKDKFLSGNLTKENFINQAMDMHNQLFDYFEIIKNTDINKINITQDGVSFLIGEYSIKLFIPSRESRVVPLEIMNFGRYEPDVTYIMDLLTPNAKQILDIGANIGYHSIRFAKCSSECIIHAFEPVPVSHSYLQRNVTENNVRSQISTYNIGLSDNNGKCDFFIPPSCATNASITNVSGASNAEKITIQTMTLDDWCQNQNIRPNFIKCDIEGAELLAFRGGVNTLLIDKPLIVSEMLRKWSAPYGYHPNDMINFFNKLGYVCFGIGKGETNLVKEVFEESVETNYVFLHTEAHHKIIDKLKYLKW
jgi:FkbM family methyltransferase